MGILIKYWKYWVPALLLAAIIGGEYYYGEQRYNAGFQAATAKLEAEQEKAAREQAEAVLAKERRQQAQLAAAQSEIEKEREHAKTTIAGLYTELSRVRQTTDAHRRALSQTAAAAGTPDGETAAAGWQLFGECTERYAAVAKDADELRNDSAEWQAYGRVNQQAAE
ncbi:DUF2514 family protein [Eikenella corrodens]|uniref:DUF2514 family protein n=1 Tax=Eikenella corrodens TaxID=539 RepID=UPI00129BBBF2|nr:DUF2514 family protein [Eikenella corrodens]